MKSNTEQTSHILPLGVYFGVALALFVMTLLTVEVATFDLGEWNIVFAMVIAVFKAALVALIFMHLFWDKKIYSAVFIGAIVCLGIFISLTMFDTLKRDRIYPERGGVIVPRAVIYKTTDSLEVKPPAAVEDSLVKDSLVKDSLVKDSLVEGNVRDTAVTDSEQNRRSG